MSRTQRHTYTAHLLDGRTVRCVSVEQDDQGGMWAWTTAGERIPAAAILRLGREPVPATTTTAEALDAFLDSLPKATVSLDEYRASRVSPILVGVR